MNRSTPYVLALCCVLTACQESQVSEPVVVHDPGRHFSQSPSLNAEVPRFPEVVSVIPERTVADPGLFYELSDSALVEAVRQAGGRVSIGLKPASAARTSQSNRAIPRVTRDEVHAARTALEAQGVILVRGFRNFAAVVAEIDPADAPALRQLPQVNYVEPELPGYLQAQDTSWGVKKVNAHLAWTVGNNRGQMASVTILDNGLDLTHIVSGDGPGGFYGDCLHTDGTNTCYWNINVHGVLVAGVIAGRDNEQGYIGVAPQPANFASVKVIDDGGSIWPSAVAAGLDWAISTGYSRHIVNMSLGWCTSFSILADAVSSAANAGILMVAPVGNTNVDCGTQFNMPLNMFPARYEQVIGVSGTTETDEFWAGPRLPCGTIGSKHGMAVELAAPFWSYSMVGNGDYYWDCWTSYSAAVVTGVAALAWTAYPSFTAAQLRTHLRSTADDKGDPGFDYYFGYGRVNAAAAVGYQPPPPPPPPFTVTITGTTEIQAGQPCSWFAQTTGGTAPFSYSWRVGKQSIGTDSPEVTYQNEGSPFTLSVIVTDANSLSNDDSHSVSIVPGAGCL